MKKKCYTDFKPLQGQTENGNKRRGYNSMERTQVWREQHYGHQRERTEKQKPTDDLLQVAKVTQDAENLGENLKVCVLLKFQVRFFS